MTHWIKRQDTISKQKSSAEIDPMHFKSLFEESAGGICISGDSGTGKSVLQRQIINNAIRAGDQAVFLFDPGGDLAKEVFADCLHLGGSVTRRLHYFAPANDRIPVGAIHPLRANRQPDDSDLRHINRTECRVMHSASILLSSWGDDNFDQKPLLFKWLTLILRAAANLGLSLADTVHFFDVGSELYHVLTQSIPDEVDRREFSRLAELDIGDQEQAIASTKNRVQGLFAPPIMRTHLGVTNNAIDVRQLIENRAIVIVDLETLDQLHAEQQSLLANFWLTELFHTIFGTPPAQRLPTLIVCDELPVFRASGPMIARALRLIRKTKARFVGAFQGMHSFPKGKDDPLLRNMIQCRTRFYFRHNDEDDAQFFGGIASLPNYDPLLGKFEHWEEQQYQDGHEEVTLVDRSFNEAYSEGTTSGNSIAESEGVNTSQSTSLSQTRTEGVSETQTRTKGETTTESRSIGHGEKTSQGTSQTDGKTISVGQTQTNGISESQSHTKGETKTESTQRSVTEGTSITDSETNTDGNSTSDASSQSRSLVNGASSSVNSGRSSTRTREIPDTNDKTRSIGINSGESQAHQQSDSRTVGSTHNEAHSKSLAIGQSTANSNSVANMQGSSIALSETSGNTIGTSASIADSQSEAIARSEGFSQSVSTSDNVTESKGGSQHESKGVSNSTSTSNAAQVSQGLSTGTNKSSTRSLSEGQDQSFSSGHSMSYKTQLVPVVKWRTVLAFKEFLSSADQKHRVASLIAAQSTGQSIMMVGGVGSCQVGVEMLRNFWKGQPQSFQTAKTLFLEEFRKLPICHNASELFASLELREAKAEVLRDHLEMQKRICEPSKNLAAIEHDELPPESGIQI